MSANNPHASIFWWKKLTNNIFRKNLLNCHGKSTGVSYSISKEIE